MCAVEDNEDPIDPELFLDSQDDDSSLQGLLFETSPYGNVDAVVQHDDRAMYFYLNGEEAFGTRACWVRNLVEAPYVLGQDDLERGIPPLMPRTHCAASAGQPVPAAESLEIVWLEEGNSAALFEREELIAMIPPWSGTDGFHGYASECVSEHQLAWPLPKNPELFKRIENARQFWLDCGNEENHPYTQLQPALMEVYRKAFGEERQYYSLDAGNFPPCGAALFQIGESWVLVSAGMSFRPQPNVELFVEHPRDLRRIELALECAREIVSESDLHNLLRQFGGLVSLPWQQFTWFGPRHSCELSALATVFGDDCRVAQFVAGEPIAGSLIDLPSFRGDPVNLLKLVSQP